MNLWPQHVCQPIDGNLAVCQPIDGNLAVRVLLFTGTLFNTHRCLTDIEFTTNNAQDWCLNSLSDTRLLARPSPAVLHFETLGSISVLSVGDILNSATIHRRHHSGTTWCLFEDENSSNDEEGEPRPARPWAGPGHACQRLPSAAVWGQQTHFSEQANRQIPDLQGGGHTVDVPSLGWPGCARPGHEPWPQSGTLRRTPGAAGAAGASARGPTTPPAKAQARHQPWRRPGCRCGRFLSQAEHAFGRENGGPYLWQIGGASVPPRPGGVGEPLPSVCRERVTHSRVFVKSPLGVGGGAAAPHVVRMEPGTQWGVAHSGARHLCPGRVEGAERREP